VPGITGKDSLNFFYALPSGEIVEKKAGILFPVQDRDFVYKSWHAVKLDLFKGERQSFYLRWKSDKPLEAPQLQVYAHQTIERYDRFERMVFISFLFTMLVISAFYLLLFAILKGRQYLFFALYIGSVAIFLFITDGYLGEYFWKENNFFLKFLEKYQPYIMSWVSVFFLMFGVAYLELRKKLKDWYRAILIVIILTFVRIFMVLIETIFNFTYPDFIEGVFRLVWVITVGIIPFFILIVPAIIRIKQGFRPAWFFLVANLVLIPLIYITTYYSISSTTVLSVYESIFGRIIISSGMHAAAILQVLIFSFGIIRKMRLDEVEAKRAQDQVIEQLKINESLKDKVNRELEQKVQERTREINEQKEEIESQRDEIEAQRDTVAMQRDLVSAQKKEITDSIDYAQRIQQALLPSHDYLEKIMPEYFVLYKPKDVVSGDFYWIREVQERLVIVAADCTGHGVPGAFMSMLGITLLDDEFGKDQIDNPGEILDKLRSRLKKMLVQSGQAEEQKDGIDMALAIIDKKSKELQFAGANNPLYLIRNSKQVSESEPGLKAKLQGHGSHLFEWKGDRQPIGVHWEENPFSTHRIKLKDQDTVYVFTDGFIDQFGGERRKKFKSKRLKELLLSIQKGSMPDQQKQLEKTFENWRKEVEQIDDVCILGVRI
jgi:serine phosphatase RsbU (regulator of sigma subunit)